MKQNFDLHIHTNNSDGDYTIREILELLEKENINTFSITDHDNIDSIKEVEKLSPEIKYIKGVEISAICNDMYKLHILGYYIDENNLQLNELLNEIREARITRFMEMVHYIEEKYKIIFSDSDLKNTIESNFILGKAHLCRMMTKYGFGNDPVAIFLEYVHPIKTTLPYRKDAERVISVIKKAGGVSVLAHPRKVEDEYGIVIDDIIEKIIEIGIEGIEVYNSLHNLSDCERYLSLAKRYNLLISGGSDFHGPNTKDDVFLGVIYTDNEEKKVNEEVMTILRKKI